MNVVSLFAGIGGFDLALERAGLRTSVQVEIDEHCQDVLLRHFPEAELFSDVREFSLTRGECDIIVGGFPCQDISVAGNRAGLAGNRSGLWFEFARILDESRPEWCVIENVAGLLSSQRGRDLGTILGTLADLGYGFAYRVLDAQFFGVPQRRRRVFIVGCLGDWRRAGAVLLEPEGGCWHPPARREAREDLAGTLAARTLGGGYPGTDESCANHVVARAVALRGRDGGVAAELGTDQANCLQSGVGSSARGGYVLVEAVRKLMPVECERLQGFPDGWTEGHADTHRYRMLGNAVAVPVVEWITRRLVAV